MKRIRVEDLMKHSRHEERERPPLHWRYTQVEYEEPSPVWGVVLSLIAIGGMCIVWILLGR